MIRSLVDDALASQANRRGDYGPSRATVTIHIPSSKVGVVIGRGGETIRDLQDRSGARINVTPDNAANPQSTDRPVTLIGDDAAIQRAKALIDEIIKGGDAALDSVCFYNMPVQTLINMIDETICYNLLYEFLWA